MEKNYKKQWDESAGKPGSVEDNHSSRFYVTTKFKQPTLALSGLTLGPLFGLAPDGVCQAIISYLICGVLLPHLFTLTSKRRYIFCCTFRKLASPRSYLASCPMEPGLSSQNLSDYLADSFVLYLYMRLKRSLVFYIRFVDLISLHS